MPRALVIAYHFPPITSGGVRRTLEFVRYMPEHGWDPLLLTIDPKTSRFADPTSTSAIPEGLIVVRTPTHEPLWAIRNLPRWHLGRLIDLLMPIDQSVTWVLPAVRAGLKMINKYNPDVIYTSSSPYSVHLIGWALHRLTSKPWVADWRDLWTHAISWQGPTRLHARLNQWIERQMWSNAAITVTHSNGHRRLIQRDFPELPADRLATVLMGYDPDEFDAIDAKQYENFTMVYVGTFYGIPKSREAPQAIDARMRFWAVDRIFDRKGFRYFEEVASPKFMMQALCKVFDTRPDLSNKIRVHFLGFPRPENIEYINHLGLDEIVKHIGQVPFTESVSRMKGAHVLLLVMVPSENGRSDFVPSKVPEYLGARQPILAMIPESEVGDMINETQAGIVVDARDIDGARDAILDLYKCYEDGNLALESKPSTLHSLTWSHLAEQMVDILNRAKDSVA